MSYEIVRNKQIVWYNNDDRYILIVKHGDHVIGLNFMQGEEFEFFTKHFDYVDKRLTDFYLATSPYLSGENEVERINQAIWAYLTYIDLRAETKCIEQRIE